MVHSAYFWLLFHLNLAGTHESCIPIVPLVWFSLIWSIGSDQAVWAHWQWIQSIRQSSALLMSPFIAEVLRPLVRYMPMAWLPTMYPHNPITFLVFPLWTIFNIATGVPMSNQHMQSCLLRQVERVKTNHQTLSHCHIVDTVLARGPLCLIYLLEQRCLEVADSKGIWMCLIC